MLCFTTAGCGASQQVGGGGRSFQLNLHLNFRLHSCHLSHLSQHQDLHRHEDNQTQSQQKQKTSEHRYERFEMFIFQ